MTFYEYTMLPKKEQYELVFEVGNFIEYRREGKNTYVLYKLYHFFVEITYSNSESKIENLTSRLIM